MSNSDPMPLETLTVQLLPMESMPKGVFVQEAQIHEGSVLVVYGTNARRIGWIDLHAAFKGRVYRHHVIRQEARS